MNIFLKYKQIFLVILIAAFCYSAITYFQIEFPSQPLAGVVVQTNYTIQNCPAYVSISPLTKQTGIKGVFVVNEDVDLTISISEPIGCPLNTTYLLKSGDVETEFRKTLSLKLITNITSENEFINLQVFSVDSGNKTLRWSKTLQIVSQTKLEELNYQRLAYWIPTPIASIPIVLSYLDSKGKKRR